tara:strand:+ start:992 stop:1552 length:561 start_codon:yes stop_codon:yes gene_type:complete
MFIRKTAQEEIKIEEVIPRLDLTEVHYDFSRIDLDPIHIPHVGNTFNFPSLIDEFKRTPEILCANADPINETESLISLIPAEIWMKIFSYLDITSLTHVMISCKKMADLANDNRTRERLYKSRENHRFFKFLQPEPTVIESFVTRHPVISQLLHNTPAHPPQGRINLAPAQIVYNDNPPGKGFVMG